MCDQRTPMRFSNYYYEARISHAQRMNLLVRFFTYIKAQSLKNRAAVMVRPSMAMMEMGRTEAQSVVTKVWASLASITWSFRQPAFSKPSQVLKMTTA